MSFAPDEDQQELAATVRAVLAKHAGDQVWPLLCEQVGVAALAVPEEYDGAGFTLAETQVVLEEVGAALAPCPLLGSAVLAAQALLLAGNETVSADLLPGIAAGTTTAALAWAGPAGWSVDSVPVTAVAGRLTGTSTYVLDGDVADVLLVLAATGAGIGLFRVDPTAAGVTRTHSPTMDQTLRLASVTLSDVAAELVADGVMFLPRLFDIACAAVTAMQVGAMQRCLDMTVAYSLERVQFGRPIGSFQALKHRMADLLVEVETSRSISWAAAQPGADSATVATAKVWCSDALNHVAAETIQLHGGIAITWEHDAHRYFKRAHALSTMFGQPHEHRARLAAHL